MGLRDKMRMIGVGSDENSEKLRETEFHQVQHDVDIERLRADARIEISNAEVEARAKQMRMLSDARREIATKWGDVGVQMHEAWGRATGLPPLILGIVLTAIVFAIVLSAYPVMGMIQGHTVMGYAIREGTGSSTAPSYIVTYRPKKEKYASAAEAEFRVYVPATSAAVAQRKFEELLALHGNTTEFKLEPTTSVIRCWQVVELIRYDTDQVVSPCFPNYGDAALVLAAYQNGTLDQVDQNILNSTVYFPPANPEVVITPTRVVTAQVPATPAHTTVVFVPDSRASEYEDLFAPLPEDESEEFLLNLNPDEVVRIR
jgi:hypothetical protein